MAERIGADGMTDFERRYLAGNGYDVYCASYRRNREAMLQEVRARQARIRVGREQREAALAEILQIAAPPAHTAGRRALGLTIARTYGVAVVETDAIPADTVAFANWLKRRVTMRPNWAETAAGFAVLLHEVAHNLVGRCPNTAPHQRDTGETRWWHCLACETAAWERATRIVPFSREMFQMLQRSLRTYRRTTPGPPAAKDGLRRVASDNYFAARVQARADYERRLSMVADIEAIAADAQRPVLRRWQRQYVEIQQIARRL